MGNLFAAIKNSAKLRWIMLVPLTLLGTSVAFVIGFWFMFAVSWWSESQFFWYRIFGVITSVSTIGAWLYISHAIAPFHKSKVIWISYVAGLIPMLVVFDEYIYRGLNGDITTPFVYVCSGIIVGFEYSIYLFRKSDI